MSKQLTMCILNGMFIVGELQGSRLLLPRLFSIINGGAEVQLSPLPFVPMFVIVGSGCATYPMPFETSKHVYDLWERVTNPELIKQAQEKPVMEPRLVPELNS